MNSYRYFQILTVLGVILDLQRSSQDQAITSSVQATSVEKVMEERAIGSSYISGEDSARAPTEAAGRLNDELNDTKQASRTGSSEGITEEYEEKGPTPSITKATLSSERKAEISETLASHRNEIAEMRIEWQEITSLFELLKDNKENLEMHVKPKSTRTIEDIMEELRIFYQYVSHLVQNRLRELGGLGGIVIGAKIQNKEENYFREDLGVHRTGEEKLGLKPEDEELQVSKQNSETIQKTKVVGHSALHVLLREKVDAQSSFSENSDVSSLKGPTFEEDEGDLGHDPSELIAEKLISESLQYLDILLHSFTFSSAPEYIYFSEQEMRRVTKTALETFIFQVLQFMYKFEMIRKEHLRMFFSRHETQASMAIHLADLLNIYWGGFFTRQTNLLPDMDLLMRHWRTQHLHITLRVLDENQLKSISYRTLIETIGPCSLVETFSASFQPTVGGLFIKEEFLSRLEEWEKNSKKDSNYKDMELHSCLKELTDYFQNPVPKRSGPSNIISQRIDYLITCCALKFINDHHPKLLATLFESGAERKAFQMQYLLIEAGLYLHLQSNQVLEYELQVPDDYSIPNFTPKYIEQHRKAMLKEDVKELIVNYIELLKKVSKLSERNSEVKEWMNEISISSEIVRILTEKALSLETKPELMEKLTNKYRNSYLV